jgi:aldose 1-epimerase
MFDLNISEFGEFRKYELLNSKTGNGFAIVPEYGGIMVGLYFKGNNIIDTYSDYESLVENKWSKNVLLFPFPNRLRDGKYSWEGKTYSFDINNKATGNAIHGFSKNVPMRVTNIIMESYASLTCTYIYDGWHEGFPFPFDFNITYEMDDNSGLEVTMQVTNLHSESIPWGMGWHPYFDIADTVDEVSMLLPKCQKIEIDDRMLPTNVLVDFQDFKAVRKIGDYTLDNGFKLMEKEEKASVYLESDKYRLEYWQETGNDKWNFLQIFTPPHRQSIALEPMTCNIDAFNNGNGLKKLAPGESMEGKFGVKLY